MRGPSPVLWGGASTLDRRQFLRLGATAAVATSVGGLAGRPAWGQGVASVPSIQALSVGFVEGSEGYPSLFRPPWQMAGTPGEALEVVAADRMPLGDQRLAATTVLMKVHGLYPAMAPRRALQAVGAATLIVFYPSEDPLAPDPLPFFAWGARRRPAPTAGAPVAFAVPLREDGGLELMLEVVGETPVPAGSGRRFTGLRGGGVAAPPAVPASRPRVTSLWTDFTVDWTAGRPKLQRGLYLLALAPGVWRSDAEVPARGVGPPDELCSLAVSFEPLSSQ